VHTLATLPLCFGSHPGWPLLVVPDRFRHSLLVLNHRDVPSPVSCLLKGWVLLSTVLTQAGRPLMKPVAVCLLSSGGVFSPTGFYLVVCFGTEVRSCYLYLLCFLSALGVAGWVQPCLW
jgi:hypothetical protein